MNNDTRTPATPVILDTDIGTDVDDVWALAMLLNCPELDVKLITTATGDTVYRARVAAKLLETAGRTDIPIGIGLALDAVPLTHSKWLDDYRLEQYPGPVLPDGVGAICDTVLASDEPVTIIGIGPLPNVAAALARTPVLTANARFVGMHGSIRTGYLRAPEPAAEFNVRNHALACRAVFQAEWDKLITPLDTCGDIILRGQQFQRVLASDSELTRNVVENHFGWCEAVASWPMMKKLDPPNASSILFDTVAIYLAMAEDLVEIETLPLAVTDDGYTVISDEGSAVRCATRWRDRDAFIELLLQRLAS